jgi:ABC-2 type transport system permease protein
MQPYHSGLEQWLQHYGLKLRDKLVLDPRNSALPVPVVRQVGGFRFQEMHMIDYPYFADLRGKGLNHDNAITSGLNQLSMAWASPIEVDRAKNKQRQVTELLHSSEQAWLSSSMDVMPKIDKQGNSDFTPVDVRDSYLLGVITQGRFKSYFAGQTSPLLEKAAHKTDKQDSKSEKAYKTSKSDNIIGSVIEHSPDSARIILYSSNDFLNDRVIQLASSVNGSRYRGGVQLIANTVDWSLEEQGLLGIRSRGHFNRTLPPMQQDTQMFWESINYAMAVLILFMLAIAQRYRRKRKAMRYFNELAV